MFLTQSTFTVKSDEYDGKYLLSVVAIPLVLRSCVRVTRCCNCCSGMSVSTSEGDGNAQRIMLLLVKVYII